MLICPQHSQLSPSGHSVNISSSPINIPKRKFSLKIRGQSFSYSSMYLNFEKSCIDGRIIQYVCQNYCGILHHVQKIHFHSLFKNMVLLQQIVMLLCIVWSHAFLSALLIEMVFFNHSTECNRLVAIIGCCAEIHVVLLYGAWSHVNGGLSTAAGVAS
jgi:hypothetical protein